ncbi:TPA: hypothetical protein RQN07_002763 [Aeromonas dhakensis]|uniref:hypothetical protein n=1 Tax=Aeromonas dhakensis TaxID=196024 RepID=UPI002890848F|nr:hypothetical protein [Aeromonas dhakensis]HDX8469031.1 hypothetical protein [Aeromonas dhakensis]HDZ8869546.1 hypothetical protein [Aeromonas dhakensis]HDZ8931166.1 hypothetical protein [Aeromonas dhakensis]HEA3208372.1 hypothetical protein [Aeromonas dhakensis]
MKNKSVESYINTEFEGSDGVKRKMLGIVRKENSDNNNRIVSYHCPKCAEDKELYGSGIFEQKWHRLKTGFYNCGCNKRRLPTNHEATLLVKRVMVAEGNQLRFIGWDTGVYVSALKSKIIFSCKDHGESKVLYNAFMSTQASRCPHCKSGHCGYQKDKPGSFYVAKITNKVGKEWIKVGITNNRVDDRLTRLVGEHKSDYNEVLKTELMFTWRWEDGSIAWSVERDIRNIREKYGIECIKDEMTKGFTETLPLHSSVEISEIISNYVPFKVDIDNSRIIFMEPRPPRKKYTRKVKDAA